MSGTYHNDSFGQSFDHDQKIVNLNGVHDLKILANINAKPVLEFDGPGAIVGGSLSDPIEKICTIM